jgi:hypothetical protein
MCSDLNAYDVDSLIIAGINDQSIDYNNSTTKIKKQIKKLSNNKRNIDDVWTNNLNTHNFYPIINHDSDTKQKNTKLILLGICPKLIFRPLNNIDIDNDNIEQPTQLIKKRCLNNNPLGNNNCAERYAPETLLELENPIIKSNLSSPDKVDIKNSNDIFYDACKYGNIDTIKKYILCDNHEKGTLQQDTLTYGEIDFNKGLEIACDNNQYETVKFLLKFSKQNFYVGNDKNKINPGKNDNYLIKKMYKDGRTNIFGLFLSYSLCDPRVDPNCDNNYFIMDSVVKNKHTELKYIISLSSHHNIINASFVLSVAILYDKVNIVGFILTTFKTNFKCQYNLNLMDNFLLACRLNKFEIIDLFIKYSEDCPLIDITIGINQAYYESNKYLCEYFLKHSEYCKYITNLHYNYPSIQWMNPNNINVTNVRKKLLYLNYLDFINKILLQFKNQNN